MAGTELVRQGNQETTLRPGDFIIWDSAQKMEFRVLEPLHKLTILASKSLLDRFLLRAEQFAGMRIEGTATLGPVVGAYLRQLWGRNKNCSQTMGWMAPAPDGAKMSPFKVDERERRSWERSKRWAGPRQIGVSGPCR
jgi:hypothetical protein